MKNPFWQICFGFLLVVSILAFLEQGLPRIYEVIDLVIFCLGMLAFFSVCWEKPIIPKSPLFWKIFFFIFITWNIYQQYFLSLPDGAREYIKNLYAASSRPAVATINLLIYLPVVIGVYAHAFFKHKK